jgi:hypothetical protein
VFPCCSVRFMCDDVRGEQVRLSVQWWVKRLASRRPRECKPRMAARLVVQREQSTSGPFAPQLLTNENQRIVAAAFVLGLARSWVSWILDHLSWVSLGVGYLGSWIICLGSRSELGILDLGSWNRTILHCARTHVQAPTSQLVHMPVGYVSQFEKVNQNRSRSAGNTRSAQPRSR